MSDQPERKQINFTIVPDEQPGEPRTYANFCSIAHTPFDFTLTFCEVMPLSETGSARAPSRTTSCARRCARASSCRCSSCPTSIAALQEHMRVFSETYSNVGWTKAGPIH